MSGFLNKLSQSLSSSKPELDETGKAILDIENKKKTIIQASNNEQNSIKTSINDQYKKIGETSYTLYADGSFELEKIAGMFETVKGLCRNLDEKQAKLQEILSRYDEELKILRPAPTLIAGQALCPSCNSVYIPGEMAFCATCGNKLDAAATTTGQPQALPATRECAGCNTANVVDAVFCSGCGGKL